MLKPLNDRALLNKFRHAQTYMMYHQDGLGAFYTGILRRTELRLVDAIPGNVVAAVTMKNTHPVLLLAPDFFDEPLKEQVMTLHHELRHLIYEHPILWAGLRGPKVRFTYPNGHSQEFEVANLAMDAAINEMESGGVPKGWILPQTFGAPSGRNTLFYYKFLMEQAAKNPSGGGQGSSGQPGGRQPGGQPSDPSDDQGDDLTDAPKSETQKLMEAIAEAFGQSEQGNLFNPHEVWTTGPEGDNNESFNPDLAQQSLRQIVKEAAEQLSGSQRSTLPGYIQEAIEAAKQENLVPWWVILRRITARMGGVKVVKTIARKHKNLGIRPGIKVTPTWRLVVFIDESGSIEDSEWKRFVSEIYYLWQTGAEITIVTHTTTIHQVYEFNGKNLHKKRAYGGTDHTACVEWLNKHRYDGAIFLTDGETGVREGLRPKVGCKAVWVISPGGSNPHKYAGLNWGTIVWMKKSTRKVA